MGRTAKPREPRRPAAGKALRQWLEDGARIALTRDHPDIPRDVSLSDYITGLKARIAALEAGRPTDA